MGRLHRVLALTLAVVSLSAGFAAPAAGQDQAPAPVKEPHAAGTGFKLYEDESLLLRFRVYTTFRYLNQTALDDTYTDAFGTTRTIDLRQDMQLNKMNFYFFGWFLDPRFRYLGYVWTSNPSQGLGAQVVVAGNLQYRFNDSFNVGVGISGLPGTRTVEGQWPFWLGVDQRLLADEFFRPSYTSGIWSKGRIASGLEYSVMLGNNLSQLGIDAGQLDDGLNTWSGVLTWMPTTGEYGGGRYGDFEQHDALASRLALHYTRSDENKQGQPSTEAPENSQIRLSDGNVIFNAGLFGPGTLVTDVRYQMASFDAGLKTGGFALEGDYYLRRVDDLRGVGLDSLGFDHLTDHGFQVQASKMLQPQKLQLYASGSKVFGEYGDPWDTRLGVNFFPGRTQAVRLNGEFIYVEGSPVGGLSLPLTVGATGPIFAANLEVNF